MIAVIQRVSEASVTIEGQLKSKIRNGLMILVGIEDTDNDEDIALLRFKGASADMRQIWIYRLLKAQQATAERIERAVFILVLAVVFVGFLTYLMETYFPDFPN